MGSLTNYAENILLDALLGTNPLPSITTVYLGLFTTAPTDTTAGVEVSGSGYSRQEISFSGASNGLTISNIAAVFTATANWGSIVAVGIFDASTGGNLLLYQTINPIIINNTDTLNFTAGNVTATLD